MPKRGPSGGALRIKTTPKQIASIVIIIVFAFVGAMLLVNWVTDKAGIDTGDDDTIIIDTGDEPGTMLLQFAMRDIVDSGTMHAANDYADFWVASENPGVIDFSESYILLHDVAAAVELSDSYFTPGDIVIIHCMADTDATGGAEYYDSWFIVELAKDEVVYWFDFVDPDDPADQSQRFDKLVTKEGTTSVTYRLKDNWKSIAEPTGYKVSITGGVTPYWDIGTLKLWPRLTAANLDLAISYSGTVLDTILDGASNTTNEGADGCATVPTAVTGKTNVVDILISGGVVDVGFGKPLLYVKPSGEIVSREAFVCVYFNQSTVGHDYLVDHGWRKMSPTAAYLSQAYYYPIPASLPDRNDKVSIDIDLYLDTTDCTASAGLAIFVTLGDGQDENALLQGIYSTANPTFYGMSDWGIDAPIYPTGPTFGTGLPTQAMAFAAIENSA